MNKEKQEAAIASVLSCLQSPVLCIEIKNQVENSYKQAVMRYTGLSLLEGTISEDAPVSHFLDVVNCLRELQSNKKGLNHYLDGVHGGCN